MKSSPVITVVIPTYNRASFIAGTIQSILDQDFADFELIVVDDGSTDNTGEVVMRIMDTRLRYVKKQNAERAAARNMGAQMAKGAYLNFFDSDDQAYQHHLSTAQAIIGTRNQPEVFHLGYDVKDDQGKILRVANQFPLTINSLLHTGNHLSCNGVFLRRDVALALPFVEDRALSASEDYELWLRLASRFNFLCYNKVTSSVIDHTARSVLSTDKEKLLRRIEALKKYLKQDTSFMNFIGRRMPEFESHLNVYVALHLALGGYPASQSFPFLTQAFVKNPKLLLTRKFLTAIKHTVL